MRLIVRRLDDSWAERITALRLEAYGKFGTDLRNANPLSYGPTDRRNVNLGITARSLADADLREDRLLSLLRIEKHESQDSLTLALQTTLNPIEFPAVVLSRAATARGFEQRGFGMYLRMIALKSLVASGYKEVFGTFKASSQRSQFLASLGYELTTQTSTWSDFLKTEEPVTVARLDLQKNGTRAIEMLEHQISGDLLISEVVVVFEI